MHALFLRAETHSLQAVREKYSRPKFLCVAKLTERELRWLKRTQPS